MTTDRSETREARRQGSAEELVVELYRAALLAADEILRSETLDAAQIDELGETLDAIHAALAGR